MSKDKATGALLELDKKMGFDWVVDTFGECLVCETPSYWMRKFMRETDITYSILRILLSQYIVTKTAEEQVPFNEEISKGEVLEFIERLIQKEALTSELIDEELPYYYVPDAVTLLFNKIIGEDGVGYLAKEYLNAEGCRLSKDSLPYMLVETTRLDGREVLPEEAYMALGIYVAQKIVMNRGKERDICMIDISGFESGVPEVLETDTMVIVKQEFEKYNYPKEFEGIEYLGLLREGKESVKLALKNGNGTLTDLISGIHSFIYNKALEVLVNMNKDNVAEIYNRDEVQELLDVLGIYTPDIGEHRELREDDIPVIYTILKNLRGNIVIVFFDNL